MAICDAADGITGVLLSCADVLALLLVGLMGE